MLNSKKRKFPRFRILNNFHKKGWFFLRNTEWSSLNDGSILVTDPKKLDTKTLTDWSCVVFNTADGSKRLKNIFILLQGNTLIKFPTHWIN